MHAALLLAAVGMVANLAAAVKLAVGIGIGVTPG